MSTEGQPLVEVDATDDTDPNNRVHHHARIRDGQPSDGGPGVITLCGIRLKGKRPGAEQLPCCPMCNLEMGMLGRSCD